jgi:hypothetical protein
MICLLSATNPVVNAFAAALNRCIPGTRGFDIIDGNSPRQGNAWDCGTLMMWNFEKLVGQTSSEGPLTEIDHQEWHETPHVSQLWREKLLCALLQETTVRPPSFGTVL